MALILAILSLWLEGYRVTWIESALILISVFIIAFFSAFGRYRRQKDFKSLSFWDSDTESVVKRKGKIISILRSKLVVGDIIILNEGDIVPADCILLLGDLLINQGRICKSFNAIKKTVKDPFILYGTKVIEGTAKALICAVGESRQMFGKNKMEAYEIKTGLQFKLEEITNSIGLMGIYVALAAFVALVGNKIVTQILMGEEFFIMDTIKILTEFLTIALVIVIVALPEGSLLAISIAWNNSLQKMKNIKVKNVECNNTLYYRL